jgi:hypothetical protein
VALALAALTYDRLADGPRDLYLTSLLHSAGTAGLFGAFGAAFWWVGPRPFAVALMAVSLAAALPPAAQHARRLTHGARLGQPFGQLVEDFDTPVFGESRWDLGGEVGAVFIRGGRGVVEPPAGKLGFLEARLRTRPSSRLGPRWVPAALDTAPYAEELSWQSEVRLDREFFVILEWEPLLIQRTRYGLHVAFPDERGRITGREIHQAPDGARTWRLRRAGGQLALEIDGQGVWSALERPFTSRPRFGESRTDAEHGGRMELEWVRYHRWVAPVPPLFTP